MRVKPLGDVTSVDTDTEAKAQLPVVELRVPGTHPIMKLCQPRKLFLYCKENYLEKFWFLENKTCMARFIINTWPVEV